MLTSSVPERSPAENVSAPGTCLKMKATQKCLRLALVQETCGHERAGRTDSYSQVGFVFTQREKISSLVLSMDHGAAPLSSVAMVTASITTVTLITFLVK